MPEKKAEPDKKADAQGDKPKKSKKGLFLGGGVVGLIAMAYALFLVAVPKAPKEVPLKGPFVITLCQGSENLQANLAGDGGKRFISMVVKAEYRSYDEAYAAARAVDPLYQARERDAILFATRKKTKADLDDTVGVDVYKRELRDALNPLLFPLHVGNPKVANAPDEESGLAPGTSSERSTLLGGFHAHHLSVDPHLHTLKLDAGEPVQFDGSEHDLLVQNELGQAAYVDVTGLKPDFEGEVPIGTFGQIENVFFGQFIVQ